MPTKYIRKSQRASYSEQDLKTAVERVRRKELTNAEASRLYGIPTSTLNDRVKQRTGQISDSLGRPTSIPPEMEKSLADCLRTIEKWGWGLSRSEVFDLVQQFVKKNGLNTPFRDDRPGKDWFIGFRKRHGLSIKKAQPVEYLRKKMTDPFVINEYFSLLGDTLTKLKLDDPRRIWNIDETAVCLDPTRTKVVGGVGAPCVRTTAGSGRENITVLAAVNAAGEKLNPLVIYKGKNMYEQWMSKPNPEHDFELAYAATKRGWIETEAFYNYMSTVMIPNMGEERPVLLIYDGHTTHLDVKVVALAAENDITILKLPAHTSHLLQPLDLSVFKSFKNKWDMKLVEWQRQNVGLKLKKQEFAGLFADTWHQTTPSVIQSGFKKGGIYPFNPTVIPKEKFDPAAFKRWAQQVSKTSVKPLTELCLAVINKCITDISPDSNNQNISDRLTVSFEQLLLEKITQQPRTDANKNLHKLKRIAKGAEVITNTFLEQQKVTQVSNDKETDITRKKMTAKKKGKCGKKGKLETSKSEQKNGGSNTSDTEIAGSSGLQVKHKQVKKNNMNPRKQKKTIDTSAILTEQIKNTNKFDPKGKGKGKGKKTLIEKENIQPTYNPKIRNTRSSSITTTPDNTVVSLHSESELNSLPNPFLSENNDAVIFEQLTREQINRGSNTFETEIAGPSGLQVKHKQVKKNNMNPRKPKKSLDTSAILTEQNKNTIQFDPKGKGKGKKTLIEKENIQPTSNPKKRNKRSSSITTTPDSTVVSLHSESELDSLPDALLSENYDPDIFEQLTREQEIDKIVKEMYDADKTLAACDNKMPKIDTERVLESTEENSKSSQQISSSSSNKKKVTVLSSIRFAPENRPFCLKSVPEAHSSHSHAVLNPIDKKFDIFTSHKKRKNSTQANADSEPKKPKRAIVKQCNQRTEIDEIGERNYEMIKMLKIGDTVLCRYHTRGWKYYVGVIESVDSNTQDYTIWFYKTIVKKDFIKFVIPKRKDQDLVPACNIVKTIDLLQFNETPVEYTLMNDEESSYF